ncbi:MAG: hypothetical protein H8E32_13390, partial [Nitrospinae bacterium]|nr:hypothetical protein [Nitrospinota bacterium]
MKLITFSLWGSDPKYLKGALKNAELAKSIYPEWKCRFYIAQSVPSSVVCKLEEYDNVEAAQIQKWGDWTFSYNRFLPLSENGVEVVISRDTDSRLSDREKFAVDEWLNSSKSFHIMRDHPWHFSYPILAGMFGCKAGTIENISRDIDSFEKIDWYHSDQSFLKHIIYPRIKESVMIHDEFFEKTPFPTKREGLEFVGQVFDEDDKTGK